MSIAGSVTSSLSAKTLLGRSHYWKVGFFLFLWLLITHGFADEICFGIPSMSFANEVIFDDTTCTVTDSISVGPDVTLLDNISLYAPVVGFTGPVDVLGRLRVAARRPGILNDTGINWGGDYPSGNNWTCTSNIAAPQDCDQGRDATHNDDSDGHAGFSFTKLDTNGNPLPPSTSAWSCVRDNVTGLVWEVKTDDGGIHDKDNYYRWGGKTALGSGYGTYYDDWDTLVDGANAESFCGFSDWRVPSRKELENIVSRDRYNPSVDTTYFPNTKSLPFWSSSPNAYDSSGAWVVHFSGGGSNDLGRDGNERVRLVRSGA